MLESDENIKKLKGLNRPVKNQNDRAKILSCFSIIDYVVLLPKMKSDQDYLNIIKIIKPSFIAVTKNDPKLKLKKTQIESIGGELKIVNKIIKQKSTTLTLNKLNNNY